MPAGVAVIETDDDELLTIEKWPREVFRPHYHEEFNWLVLTRPGRMVVRVEERERTLDANHWICVFPRTAHAIVLVSDDCEVMSLFVSEDAMLRGYEAMGLGPIEGRCVFGSAGVIAQGLALAWGEMRFARRTRDPVDRALEDLVTRWIWRAYGSSIELAPTWAQRARLKLGPLGGTIAAFRSRSISPTRPSTWDALSQRAGLSRRTLQRRVFEALGVPPGGVLAGMRLDRARDLLADRGRAIGDVALACGFSSQSHFSTAFKAEHCMTPAQYRHALVAWRQNSLSPLL